MLAKPSHADASELRLPSRTILAKATQRTAPPRVARRHTSVRRPVALHRRLARLARLVPQVRVGIRAGVALLAVRERRCLRALRAGSVVRVAVLVVEREALQVGVQRAAHRSARRGGGAHLGHRRAEQRLAAGAVAAVGEGARLLESTRP